MLRYIILLTATLAAAHAAATCLTPRGCTISGSDLVCNGIEKMPTCLPTNITSLIVMNSLNLHNVTSLPDNITKLQMNSTGLTNLSPTAISTATNLEVLRIKYAPIEVMNLGSTRQSSLKILTILNCTSLYSINGISNYVSLREITISSTNIQTIQNAMFQGLRYVTMLDISYNKRLYKIDESAFKDLVSLKNLYMNRCRLDTLYGSYFDNINSNKGYVNALANPYECWKLCDFMNWYWAHRDFYSRALLGTCTIPASSTTVYVYQIYEIGRYEAGCPPIFGIVIGVIVGFFFLICLGACVAVVLCGIDYRKYCCFCCESQRNRRENQSGQTSQDIHFTCHPDMDKPQMQFPMYEDTPPTYEELTIPPEVNNAASTTTITLENTSATSTS